jgi:hypothetical protein
MSDEIDTKVPEVVGGQFRQHRGVDRIVAKRRFVLLHSEAVEPGCDVHARLPAAAVAARVYLTAIKSCGREISAAGRRRGSRDA